MRVNDAKDLDVGKSLSRRSTLALISTSSLAALLGSCGEGGAGTATSTPASTPTPTAAPTPIPSAVLTIAPNDAGLKYSSFASTVERSAARFRGGRANDTRNCGYLTPGGRLAFTTDASAVYIDVTFSSVVDGNAIDSDMTATLADIVVDGVRAASEAANLTAGASLTATIAVTGLAAGAKTIELFWPNEAQMDLNGVRIVGTSVTAASAPTRSLVCGGDSITEGLGIHHPTASWPVLLGKAVDLEPINMGYAGRYATIGDGMRDGVLGGAVGIYMIGFNNYYLGQPRGDTIAQLSADIDDYLANWFSSEPLHGAQLVIVSPIYSTFAAANPTYSLQQYRDVLRARCSAYLVASPGASLHYVDGLSLMTNSADRLVEGIHPNEVGAAEIAANLTSIVRSLL